MIILAGETSGFPENDHSRQGNIRTSGKRPLPPKKRNYLNEPVLAIQRRCVVRAENLTRLALYSHRSQVATRGSGEQVNQGLLLLVSGVYSLKVGRKLVLGQQDSDHLGAQVDGVRFSSAGGVGSD